jgi:NhaC family Na+:H+ antiporter|tara:strand:- start:41304 stop:42746 length:1443 start_codon:yes stop_codon:yes gene_type:complete
MSSKTFNKTSLGIAFLPIVFLVSLLGINIYFFGDDAGSGPNQIALLFGASLAIVLGFRVGFKWKRLQKGMIRSIKSALPAILILLMIGALTGTWVLSGVVPTMIYYGLQILNPTIFLFAACIVSAIVSVATGSSWSTVATVGVALLAIGQVLGLGNGLIAGAIISGAYFGDKMSPLSDTTNLAPAMAGTELFKHIRYMTITTFPTMAITLVIFLILGLNTNAVENNSTIDLMLSTLDNKFFIHPILFLVPIGVVLLIVKKVQALPALFIGTLLGAVFAIIFQPDVIKEVSGVANNYGKAAYMAVMKSISSDVAIVTPLENVNGLLETSGMAGMMNTIWLIICAMCFGGVMETTGFLNKITSAVVKRAKSTGALIASTAATCIFFNATASDQYLAIVVPGKMFAETYKERGLAPENLSRTLEDSGTVTSVLIPWNTCGAAQSSVLGVATGEYWMYCFFNWMSPIMTVLFGYLNIKIKRIAK